MQAPSGETMYIEQACIELQMARMPKAFPSAGRSTAAGERPCDIVHTTDRDQAIEFVHPDVAWTGSTHSCRLAVLCMHNVSVSSIKTAFKCICGQCHILQCRTRAEG